MFKQLKNKKHWKNTRVDKIVCEWIRVCKQAKKRLKWSKGLSKHWNPKQCVVVEWEMCILEDRTMFLLLF